MSNVPPFGLSPTRTVVTSFNPRSSSTAVVTEGGDSCYEDGDWVLCLAGNEVQNLVACALSSGEIQLYDRNTFRLIHSLEGQNNDDVENSGHILTEITFETFDANVIAATSTDGNMKLFDIRQHANGTTLLGAASTATAASPVVQMKLPRPEEEALCLSIGFDGNIAAVGSNKGKIHFFDVRQSQQILGTYKQSHTNEVTKLCFQPTTGSSTSSMLPSGTRSTTPLLLSGSEDGLACIFDTSQPTEDDALQNILTVQAPIREVGFFGPNSEAVYCLTGSESLQLYNIHDSICRMDYGMDFRSHLSNGLLHHHQQQQQLSVSGLGINNNNNTQIPLNGVSC